MAKKIYRTSFVPITTINLPEPELNNKMAGKKMILTPEIFILDSKMLEAYKKSINSYKGKALDALNIFEDKKGELVGSNCFAPLKLREFLPESTRLATMADLGKATEINSDFLKGFYSDTGLILRTVGDSYSKGNDFLAKDLANQLEKRGITLDNPKVIYFDALDLREDSDSAYGLAYNLNERAKLEENIIDAPELVSNFKFKTMNKKGIPIKDEKGRRTLYLRGSGLSGFLLNRLSSVDSAYWILDGSGCDGRIVVVKEGKKKE